MKNYFRVCANLEKFSMLRTKSFESRKETFVQAETSASKTRGHLLKKCNIRCCKIIRELGDKDQGCCRPQMSGVITDRYPRGPGLCNCN